MSAAQKEEAIETKTKFSIEDAINRAIKKIGARKENELCKYLPMKTGGYMHHFTFKKNESKTASRIGSDHRALCHQFRQTKQRSAKTKSS